MTSLFFPPPFAIGDLQGCDCALNRLLEAPQLADAPLRLAGDLVNRGPDSAATLRRVIALGPRAQTVLGNHDIHLLAVAAGVRQPGRRDTLDALLAAPDAPALLNWLRHRPLAIAERGFLLVHAGVLPQWDVAQVLELADEIERHLRSPRWKPFLAELFGNEPRRWHDGLRGMERCRAAINALTRLRFCTADGTMEFASKEGVGAAPPGFMPWFDVPDRHTTDTTIVFGHWSTLGLLLRDKLIGLDTGCVWGGKLTAVSLDEDPRRRSVVQVSCEQALDPLR